MGDFLPKLLYSDEPVVCEFSLSITLKEIGGGRDSSFHKELREVFCRVRSVLTAKVGSTHIRQERLQNTL